MIEDEERRANMDLATAAELGKRVDPYGNPPGTPRPGAVPVEQHELLVDDLEHGMQQAGVHDRDLVKLGVRAMLRLAGEDPARVGLRDTPGRYLKAWLEMTSRPGDPRDLLAVMFDDAGPVDEMVCVGPMRFTSLCEHHLLPFTGTAFIAYVPEGGVVGLSKLPRLLEHFARRPQVQERLTGQLTEAIAELVPCKGVGAVLTAMHSCASMRGVKTEAPMTTSSLLGIFREDYRTRAEFLALAHRR